MSTIKKITTNYSLRIPVFDAPGWGREMERNFEIVDSVMFLLSNFGSVKGLWLNGTAYNSGDRVVDPSDGKLYQALVDHTSAATGTFAQDRAAHPTYWKLTTNTVQNRGEWATGVTYNVNDFIVHDHKYGVAVTGYTSDVSYDADVLAGNIVTLIDLTDDYTDVTNAASYVSSMETAINALYGIRTDVTAVANIDADVAAVSAIAADVTTAASNTSNISTVVTNIADVQTAAANMAAIQAAPGAASDAEDARDFAFLWSNEAEDIAVNDGVHTGYSTWHWYQKVLAIAFSIEAAAMMKVVYDPDANEANVFDLSNQYGNKPTNFATVADLLADTSLGYSAARRADQVAAGMIVTAQGFRYEVAASGATDHYIATAGGVKLYVLPGQDGWVSTEAVNNNPALLQKLIDNFSRVRAPAGVTFALTSGLVASSKCTEIDFSGATFDLNVEGTFFSGPGTILANRIYRLGFIRTNQPNSKGIDWTWFSYCTISAFTVRVGGANSVAVYARGNGLGTGPYYNNISDFYAYGMNNNVAYPNQRLLAFERAASGGFSADGPNGNNLSNIKRLAAAAIAVDMQSGNGNKFSNVQVEAISQEIFAFNNHGGSEQKAAGNTITNWRVEGSTTAVTCHFYVGSRSNKVTNGFETSTGPVKLINDSDYSNVYAPAGREVTLDFFGTIGTAGTVHNLSPARTGAFGGAAVPFSGYVHSVVARARGVPSNVVGTATVKVYKTGTLNDTLPAMVFNNPNYSDRRAVAPGWSVTDTRQVCLWESAHALAVDVETSADWNAASGQVHVQVVFMA